MPKTVLPIANGFYVSDSLPISAQECVNFFPVIEDAPSLNGETLRGSPGLEQVGTTGTSSSDANRGSHLMGNTPYFVNGPTLYKLNDDYSIDALGTITGSGPVSMADNGSQLMILDPNLDGFIYTKNTGILTQITDTDFTANGLPKVVVFIDGYFCCTTTQKKFIVSALNDGLSWDALDFGSAETDSDGVVAPIVYKNQLFIGGNKTIEAFSNTGGAGFPFTRSGLFIDQGLAGKFVVASGPDVFIFVGQDSRETPAVWSFYGNSTTKISTLAIDHILGGITKSEAFNITSWSYGQNGHYFVGFVLPETTIVYDISTSKWHERKSRLVTNGVETIYPWRAVNTIFAWGEMFAGDALDGHIGRVSQNLKDEYSYEIVRTFATQPFQNNMDPFFVPMIELTIEAGTGITSADGILQPACKVYECDAIEEYFLNNVTGGRGLWSMLIADAVDIGRTEQPNLVTTAFGDTTLFNTESGGPAQLEPIASAGITPCGGELYTARQNPDASYPSLTHWQNQNDDAWDDDFKNDFTLGGWIKRHIPYDGYLPMGSVGNFNIWQLNTVTGDMHMTYRDYTGSAQKTITFLAVAVGITDDDWHQIAMNFSATQCWVVFDGVKTTQPVLYAPAGAGWSDGRLSILNSHQGGNAAVGAASSHMWVAQGSVPKAQIDGLADAWEINKATYTDPNPNCIPP